MVKYQYKPIALDGLSIRLIRLLKGSHWDDIRCEIFQAWLSGDQVAMPYEALSYTWGSPERSCEITIDDQTLAITENLDRALRYLRYISVDRILWVDLISINQENLEERNHQVAHMRDIYKHAERVLIWLGMATYETNRFMDLMVKYQ